MSRGRVLYSCSAVPIWIWEATPSGCTYFVYAIIAIARERMRSGAMEVPADHTLIVVAITKIRVLSHLSRVEPAISVVAVKVWPIMDRAVPSIPMKVAAHHYQSR